MPPRRDPEVVARMRTLFDLYEAAERMQFQRLRREFPEAAAEEIKRRCFQGLHSQPVGWLDAPAIAPREED